ncbi:LuxR C-terminal-related transcriptional regulator [Streptomyces sp. NPDC006530]|uniref:LuxR C-terminal-related transcriptional regulator n=1 Tax=Streptomyces sp. NPDC006530 TaxID=3364750 RepID=UPI0036852780
MDDVAHRIYAYAARQSSVEEDDLRKQSGLPTTEADQAIQRLKDLHLLIPCNEARNRYVARPPAIASTTVLLPAIRELQQRQRELDEASALLAELTSLYRPEAATGEGLQNITDLTAVRQVITDLSTQCRSEVLTSQPGGARPETALKEASERTIGLLNRGVRMRTIYHHTAQFSQPTVRHVDMLTRLGAEVRTVSDAFSRLLVFDGEAAIIDLRGQRTGGVLVRDPSVIDSLVASFERAWAQAMPFPVTYNREHTVTVSDDLKLVLLRLLVEGHEDKIIAKRLGVSLRTYQRHLAEVMKRIGARNRLHAGYLVHKLRLLDRDS